MGSELSGLQIFKYLPAAKKLPDANCKKCGCPTCMAFALKLAKKQIEIEKCALAPEELKEIVHEAVKIKQHEYTIGIEHPVKTGGETVMFRHDKTFVNRTVFAVTLESSDENFDKKLERIKNFQIERIGETFKVDAIHLKDTGNFLSAAAKVKKSGFPVIAESDDTEALISLKAENPLIITKNSDSFKENLVAVSAGDIDSLETASKEKLKNGYKKIVLNLPLKKIRETVEELTYIRRMAVLEKFEPMTFPVMVKIPHEKNIAKTAAAASLLICRYANIIIFEDFDEAMMAALFTLRQNIFTNPQKPLQVESKVYEFNEPDENSPVILTTNFALTYFAVANELESLPFGSYLVVTPSDGMSVLTAWSADKFTADIAAKTVKKFNLAEKVKRKAIIIPGLLSHMKDELENALEGWEIIVGTIEACEIPDFIKSLDYTKA